MSRTNTLVLFLSYVFMFLSMLVHGDSIRGSIAIAMGEEPSGAGTGGGLQASQGVLGNATLNPNAWKRPAEWILYTFTVVMMITGFIICFLGFKFMRLSVFIIGGFMAALIVFAILGSSVPNEWNNKTEIVYGTSAAIWVVVGTILACCLGTAVFVLGFGLGVFVSLAFQPIVLYMIWPDNPMGNTIVWAIIFGIVGGICACFLEKVLMIVATAVSGAFLAIACIMAMDGTLELTSDTNPATWQEWSGFVGWMGLSAAGAAVQFCFFSAGTLGSGGYTKMM